ncbi:hypothetical protein K505DRAFT_326557 [Melanomma pulvis-pyrius CBS 109.77]|uniref:Uncharacterized protein n=1 Tax=Melanomma pulvis-pyrius CBS 109.77 TaxID=1314802 RepID=A0A6A6X6W3_9PLEO|nr:hypothetical protein K505DRAFT_326557 [Melanomma pulvis-pyrius CBS 109.77]
MSSRSGHLYLLTPGSTGCLGTLARFGTRFLNAFPFIEKGAFLALSLRNKDLNSLSPISRRRDQWQWQWMVERAHRHLEIKMLSTSSFKFWPSLTLSKFDEDEFRKQIRSLEHTHPTYLSHLRRD